MELVIPIGQEQVQVAVASETKEPLGLLTWYGCAEQTIPFGELRDKLRTAGVPEELWPSETRPSDAFKAAVRDVAGKDYLVEYETYTDPAGKKRTDPKTMLVVERRHDQTKDALPVVTKVRYMESKGFGGGPRGFLGFEPSPGTNPARTGELERRIRDGFDAYRTSFRADDIRGMITDALHAAVAVMVKRAGGVYFVLQKRVPTIEAVARAVESIPGAEMVAVTVIDKESERKTVLKQYEKATLERIQELMLQVQETVQKAEPIVPSALARVVEELQYLRVQKAQYEEVLAVSMGKVDVEMQVLENEVPKLAALVRTKAP